MTKDEMIEAIQLAKDMGAKSVEVNGMKIEFPAIVTRPKVDEKLLEDEITIDPKDLVAPPNPYDELTDEEVLFWSSGYGIELAEMRMKEREDNIRRLHDDAT